METPGSASPAAQRCERDYDPATKTFEPGGCEAAATELVLFPNGKARHLCNVCVGKVLCGTAHGDAEARRPHGDASSSTPLSPEELAAIVNDVERCPLDATADDPAARGWQHAARLAAEIRRLHALGLGPATQDLAARHCDRMERSLAHACSKLEAARAESDRLREELGQQRDLERGAFVTIGQLHGGLCLLAKSVQGGAFDLAEQIARDVLEEETPEQLASWHIGKDGKAPLQAWPLLVLGQALHEEAERIGAENFVEWTVNIPSLKVAVIVQRANGKTPAMLLDEAKVEIERLRTEFDYACADRDAFRAEADRRSAENADAARETCAAWCEEAADAEDSMSEGEHADGDEVHAGIRAARASALRQAARSLRARGGK